VEVGEWEFDLGTTNGFVHARDQPKTGGDWQSFKRVREFLPCGFPIFACGFDPLVKRSGGVEPGQPGQSGADEERQDEIYLWDVSDR